MSLADYNLKWKKTIDGDKIIHELIFHDSPDPKDTSDDEIIGRVTLEGNTVDVKWFDEGTLLTDKNPVIVFKDYNVFDTRLLAEKDVKDSKKLIGRETLNREEY